MWFGKFFQRSRPTREFRRFYPADRFREAIERERARADRWERPLALLSLGVADSREGEATLQQVARILAGRMRLTDEAGWLDSRHLGVLMPNTPGWGAWTLADEICLEFPDSVPLPQCKVYCYPSEWFLGDGNELGDRVNAPAVEGTTEAMEPFFFQRLPRWKRAIDVSCFQSVLAGPCAALARVGRGCPAHVAGTRLVPSDPRGPGRTPLHPV